MYAATRHCTRTLRALATRPGLLLPRRHATSVPVPFEHVSGVEPWESFDDLGDGTKKGRSRKGLSDSQETTQTVADDVAVPPPVAVLPDHGLYAFFRTKVQMDEDSGQEKTIREILEPAVINDQLPGRSWTAAELRLKSFQDLHTLWYVLLRERNLLATQREEARRSKVHISATSIPARAHMVRKSMARIKYVLNERRLAYIGAEEIRDRDRKERMMERPRESEVMRAKRPARARRSVKTSDGRPKPTTQAPHDGGVELGERVQATTREDAGRADRQSEAEQSEKAVPEASRKAKSPSKPRNAAEMAGAGVFGS